MSDRDAWHGFTGAAWRAAVDVPDFVQHNYTPYTGDASFLAGPTALLSTVERIEVLPFHRLGVAKYATLGLPFPAGPHDVTG